MEYGVVMCHTVPGVYTTANGTISVKDISGVLPGDGQVIGALSTPVTYETFTLDQPRISFFELPSLFLPFDPAELTIFVMTTTTVYQAVKCEFSYQGVESVCTDQFNAGNDRQFNLNFTDAGGIPRIEEGQLPDVRLKVDEFHFGDDCGVGTFCEPYSVWHSIEMDGRHMQNTPLTLTANPLNCGFSGGCIWEITGRGLEANIRNNISTVRVCGIEAPIVESSIPENC
jgi:hypothetical protein